MIQSRYRFLSLGCLLMLGLLINRLQLSLFTSDLFASGTNQSRILGSGFTPWIAQGIWLSRIESQHKSSPVSTSINLLKVISLEPKNRFYRTNAAGILAYDLPALNLPDHIRQDSVAKSIKLLEEGITSSPEDSPFYHYELGKIYLLKKQDAELAKYHFRLASEQTQN